MSKAVDIIIEDLENNPKDWVQREFSLDNDSKKWEIWTSNVPFINMEIHRPKRFIGLIDKTRLQLAVYRWHRNAAI
jgi:hypothetical protein